MVLVPLLASSMALACSGESHEMPSGNVVLYTSLPDPIVDRLTGVVENRFPDLDGNYWFPSGSGITLTVIRGRTADIEARIEAELDDGGIRADVIWLAEPSPYETYKEMGLLARYEPPDDAPIPESYVDPDGYYVAGRIISMVLAWNTSLHPQALADWPDIHGVASSAFPAPESGAARATVMALLDRYGTDFFRSLSEAGGVSVTSNGAARDGIVSGEFEAVAVLDYMARRAKADGEPVDFRYPASGTVLIPSPIAITSDASNPEAAEAVIDFILSQPGQEIVVEIGSFYPVRDDVAPPEAAPPLSTIAALDVDWSALAAEADAIGMLWEDVYGLERDRG